MKTNNYLAWISKPIRVAGFTLTSIGLAAFSFALTGCHGKEEEKKTHVVEVETTSPVRKTLTREVLQPGYLRPYEQTPIYSKIPGFAKEPQYDIGDFVKKGTLLVELYVPEMIQDLNVKKARVKQAEADVKQSREVKKAAAANIEAAIADVAAKEATIRSAEADVERWNAEVIRAQKLYADGIFDKAKLDEIVKQYKSTVAVREEVTAKLALARARTVQAVALESKASADIEVAEANVTASEAVRDQWKDWIDYRFITAPYDGVITARRVHTGHFEQSATAGSTSKAAEPFFMMMRTDMMRCTIDVPEVDAVLVRDGDEARIEFDAYPGVEVIGQVKRNSNALDEGTHTLRVEVWLKNPTGATVAYTCKDGTITAVEPTPVTKGAGYPRNTVLSLVISGGTGALVNATTNDAGEVVNFALDGPCGKNYQSGVNVKAETISSWLKPSLYGHVKILGKLQNAWALPQAAVLSDILNNKNYSFCFVVDEQGKAKKLFLQVGARCHDGLIQVLRKQRPGGANWEQMTGKEVIITTNTKALQEGQEVQIKTAGTAH